MKNLKKLIMDTGNYLILSKILINNLKSLDASVLLGYLIEQQEYYNGRDFFKSHNDIEKAIFMKRTSYENAKQILVEMGLIKTWVEKRITFFNIDDECYSNIEILLKEKTTQEQPKNNQTTNQTKTQDNPNNPMGFSNTYVENSKPYVENNKPYVENSKQVCSFQQTGVLKTATNNNINNNLYNNEINNLTNNENLVEEDEIDSYLSGNKTFKLEPIIQKDKNSVFEI